jgi:hypothetical protein
MLGSRSAARSVGRSGGPTSRETDNSHAASKQPTGQGDEVRLALAAPVRARRPLVGIDAGLRHLLAAQHAQEKDQHRVVEEGRPHAVVVALKGDQVLVARVRGQQAPRVRRRDERVAGSVPKQRRDERLRHRVQRRDGVDVKAGPLAHRSPYPAQSNLGRGKQGPARPCQVRVQRCGSPGEKQCDFRVKYVLGFVAVAGRRGRLRAAPGGVT